MCVFSGIVNIFLHCGYKFFIYIILCKLFTLLQ